MLDDPAIDIVSIASYDSDHHEQVMRALEHGKHVFVEKPLCQTEQQAREIHAALAARPELVLSSNLLLRASPRFELLKRWIDDGRLGPRLLHGGRLRLRPALEAHARAGAATSSRYSVTLGGTIHLIDLLLWLTGDRAVRAQATANRLVTEGTKFRFDDLVVAILELESGGTMKVAANFGCVHPALPRRARCSARRARSSTASTPRRCGPTPATAARAEPVEAALSRGPEGPPDPLVRRRRDRRAASRW